MEKVNYQIGVWCDASPIIVSHDTEEVIDSITEEEVKLLTNQD